MKSELCESCKLDKECKFSNFFKIVECAQYYKKKDEVF